MAEPDQGHFGTLDGYFGRESDKSLGTGVWGQEFRDRSFGTGVSGQEFRDMSFGTGVSGQEFRDRPDRRNEVVDLATHFFVIK